MSADFDAVIVGAGVIGLAIARQLALSGLEVMVLEKAARAGTETSSRNSEVVHAGIYYPSNSLKARLCIEGRRLLYDYCATHGVEARRLGKLIVATSSKEETKLQSIASLAEANGVDDLQWLAPERVAELEPEVRCTRALLSPSTGIIDATGYMLTLQGEAEGLGVGFAFNTTFSAAKKHGEVFAVSTSDADGIKTDVTCFSLINCSGHGAHDVAKAIEGFPVTVLPARYMAKGNYCGLSGPAPFQRLIYPVPVSGALGIHATLDMTGAVRFGPDIQWTDALDYSLAPGLPEKFVAAAETYWPGIRGRTLTPSYCGIRPKIHGPSEGFADFAIQLQAEHGIAGLVNFFGIESPGLTASLAIAEHVAHGLAPVA